MATSVFPFLFFNSPRGAASVWGLVPRAGLDFGGFLGSFSSSISYRPFSEKPDFGPVFFRINQALLRGLGGVLGGPQIPQFCPRLTGQTPRCQRDDETSSLEIRSR